MINKNKKANALKRTEEKVYDKLEKKVLSEKKKPKSQKKKK